MELVFDRYERGSALKYTIIRMHLMVAVVEVKSEHLF